jgi:phosphocarrier protein
MAFRLIRSSQSRTNSLAGEFHRISAFREPLKLQANQPPEALFRLIPSLRRSITNSERIGNRLSVANRAIKRRRKLPILRESLKMAISLVSENFMTREADEACGRGTRRQDDDNRSTGLPLMARAETEIINKLGLHARASAKLTQLAGKYASEIWMERGSRRINAKSIMGVMMLAAGRGSRIVIEATGDDEQEALDAIVQLIDDKFGEGE